MKMASTQSEPAASIYDNHGQYSRTSILRYEKIFGSGYISTGGHETTTYLCSKLVGSLFPRAKVLDVGSGIGGAAFYLAEAYGAVVTGIDLSPEMVNIAQERAQTAKVPEAVTTILGDVLTEPFADKFDVIWSRDALMHIPDKATLFSRLHDLGQPGGKLIITDYAKGVGQRSTEFHDYIEQTGYHVVDPATYGGFLEAAGFKNVVVEDATDRFIAILERELEFLKTNREEFLAAFSEEDLDYLAKRWRMKVGFCKAGDMKWGIYVATC